MYVCRVDVLLIKFLVMHLHKFMTLIQRKFLDKNNSADVK